MVTHNDGVAERGGRDTPTSVGTTDMHDNDIDRQKCVAQTDSQHLIGKDTEGRAHCYDPFRGVIWVANGWLDADCIVVAYRTRDCGGWRKYVDDRCGWEWHLIGEDSRASDEANELVRCV